MTQLISSFDEALMIHQQSPTSTKPRRGTVISADETVRIDVSEFWSFVQFVAAATESKRIEQIVDGYSADYVFVFKYGLDIGTKQAEKLFCLSQATLDRRRRENVSLDLVASERLDRIAMVANLANEVFEDQARAVQWLKTPNGSLGSKIPIDLCTTEIGANQVRRVLHAIEWGNVA